MIKDLDKVVSKGKPTIL